jgi:hypothetical protein
VTAEDIVLLKRKVRQNDRGVKQYWFYFVAFLGEHF